MDSVGFQIDFLEGGHKQSFSKALSNLNSKYTIIKNIERKWNIKESLEVCQNLDIFINGITEELKGFKEVYNKNIEAIKKYISTSEYIQLFEQFMNDSKLPFQGSFPNYDLIPFKITFSIENLECRMSFGRQIKRTYSLEPSALSKWISSNYQAVINRKFNSLIFMKDLKKAYEICVRIVLGKKEISWGTAVNINEIYEILTIKHSIKQEYPKQVFDYEIGRLRENPGICQDGFRYEFGFARNQSRSNTIIDSKGRESRISSLTIYN